MKQATQTYCPKVQIQGDATEPFFDNEGRQAVVYHTPANDFTLLQGDSLRLMKHINFAFDMIFADPPYFLSNGGISFQAGKIVSVDKGEWDKSTSVDSVDAFNQKWIALCREHLKENGTIWISGSYHNIFSVAQALTALDFKILNVVTWAKTNPPPEHLKENGTIWISGSYHNIFSVAQALTALDFKILNVVTWAKTNPPPNISCRYFTYSTEFIIWARKQKKVPHFFNYDLMKQINENKQMTDVWRLPAIAPWEKSFGKHPTQKPLSLLTRIVLASTQPGNWILDPFAGSSTTGIAANLSGRAFGKHPTQKPLSLLTRIVLASTQPGNWILDPFAGSSTTGIAANLSGRAYVGIEQENEFVELSKRRRESIENPDTAKTYRKKIKDLTLLENID